MPEPLKTRATKKAEEITKKVTALDSELEATYEALAKLLPKKAKPQTETEIVVDLKALERQIEDLDNSIKQLEPTGITASFMKAWNAICHFFFSLFSKAENTAPTEGHNEQQSLQATREQLQKAVPLFQKAIEIAQKRFALGAKLGTQQLQANLDMDAIETIKKSLGAYTEKTMASKASAAVFGNPEKAPAVAFKAFLENPNTDTQRDLSVAIADYKRKRLEGSTKKEFMALFDQANQIYGITPSGGNTHSTALKERLAKTTTPPDPDNESKNTPDGGGYSRY